MEGLSETSTMETQKTLSKIFSFNYNKVAIEKLWQIAMKEEIVIVIERQLLGSVPIGLVALYVIVVSK